MCSSVSKKLAYDDLLKSTTMFYINAEYEELIEKEVQEKMEQISVGLQTIKDKESLKQYIVKNKDSLNNLTSVIGISVERFKRMVSMIRKDHKFVFNTEWDLSKIRTAMIENHEMMENILSLIWNGKNDDVMKKCIPFFYLDNMIMDDVSLKKLQDENTIRQLVKNSMEGRYSNGIGDAVLAEIEKKLKEVCAKHGLEYQKNIRIHVLDRAVSFVLESSAKLNLILDVSYSVTTSSSQGRKKEVARKTIEILKKERSKNKNIVYVNFLDGAGWFGRQSDLKEIYRCSDYVLNFKNIDLLESIIDSHIDEWF